MRNVIRKMIQNVDHDREPHMEAGLRAQRIHFIQVSRCGIHARTPPLVTIIPYRPPGVTQLLKNQSSPGGGGLVTPATRPKKNAKNQGALTFPHKKNLASSALGGHFPPFLANPPPGGSALPKISLSLQTHSITPRGPTRPMRWCSCAAQGGPKAFKSCPNV